MAVEGEVGEVAAAVKSLQDRIYDQEQIEKAKAARAANASGEPYKVTPDEKVVSGGYKMDQAGRPAGMTDEERAKKEKREELTAWWYTQAQREVGLVIDKAIEYGAADLKVMGKAMLQLMPGGDEQPERVGLELAIAFYALGKVARLFGAFERGAVPSDDCWSDLGIYCRMAQHVREVGRWP